MSFEYFNTSHLAFGSKLTRAFRQLEKMFNDANENISIYIQNLDVIGEYVNRNYRCPFPTKPDMAVRCSELFDLINDEYVIKEAEYKDGTLKIALNTFDRDTNRMNIISGSTDLREGYAYYHPSISNTNPASIIEFTQEQDSAKGLCLFKYRVDDNNFINIIDGSSDVIDFKIGNMDKINSISLGNNITLPYTATDYCCVAVFGVKTYYWGTSFSVQLNGETIAESNGDGHKNTCFVYLKPNDVLNASVYSYAKLVNYRRV